MNEKTPNLTLSGRLKALIGACEKWCVHECCGMDAFDFSPLHIASHCSAHTGEITEENIEEIEKDLDHLVDQSKKLKVNEQGFSCAIEEMNELFDTQKLIDTTGNIKKSLRLAPKVLQYSNELEKD